VRHCGLIYCINIHFQDQNNILLSKEPKGYKLHIVENNNSKIKYILRLIVKVVLDKHLQATTRCRHWDGFRIDSKPRHNMAHLVQLFHFFTKPRSGPI